MENSFTSIVNSAASILVVLPTKPYFDQVAAALSLYLSIHDTKEVSIYSSSPMTVGFNRLIGVNKISSEIGNKNLTIRFVGYDAKNIEKVSYDIENGEFRLTVVPKTGFIAPQKNEIQGEYSGIAADLVVLIGGANDAHFPILDSKEFSTAKIAHVGTRTLDSKHEIMSFAKPGATTSELVANLIRETGLSMDPDIATNLLMGIEDGSSNFASPEVRPETFEIFAHLLRSGGQRAPRVKLSPANFPPGSIPTKPFTQKVSQVQQVEQVLQEETQVQEAEPIAEQIENKEEVVENPPDDWLQPKIYKGSSNQPDSFSENKG